MLLWSCLSRFRFFFCKGHLSFQESALLKKAKQVIRFGKSGGDALRSITKALFTDEVLTQLTIDGKFSRKQKTHSLSGIGVLNILNGECVIFYPLESCVWSGTVCFDQRIHYVIVLFLDVIDKAAPAYKKFTKCLQDYVYGAEYRIKARQVIYYEKPTFPIVWVAVCCR